MKNTKVDQLLEHLCTELGFCLAPGERERLSSSPPDSVRAFTDAVLLADGLDPTTVDKEFWRRVHDRVTQYASALNVAQMPNPSIERTSSSVLRTLPAAAHGKR